MGLNPFRGSNENFEIIIEEGNEFLNVKDNILYEIQTGKLIHYFLSSDVEEYIIPDYIKIIARYSFVNENFIKNLIIPDSVQLIRHESFRGMKSLESIFIGKNVNEILGNPFYSCKQLKNITIHEENENFIFENNSLMNFDETIIYTYLFTNETEITIPNTITTFEDRSFSGNTILEKIIIEGNIEILNSYVFHGCTQLQLIEYKGITSPNCGEDDFLNTHENLVIKVTSDYKNNTFCDITVTKENQ